MAPRFCILTSLAVILLALVTRAQQNQPISVIVAAQAQASPSAGPATSIDCYMPAPDATPTPTPQNPSGQPSSRVKAAKPAKDDAAKITLKISKPLPLCASDLSSMDSTSPSLSTSTDGYAPGPVSADPLHPERPGWIGSPECMLVGLSSSNFAKCNAKSQTGEAKPGIEQKEKKNKGNANEKNTEAAKERARPDYAIINVVRWYVEDDMPARDSEWYLYDRHSRKTSQWNLSDGLRLKGSDEVGFLAVHFGIDDTCSIGYTVEAKQRTPANLSDLQQLLQAAESISGVSSYLPKDLTDTGAKKPNEGSGAAGGPAGGASPGNALLPSNNNTEIAEDQLSLTYLPADIRSGLAEQFALLSPEDAKNAITEHSNSPASQQLANTLERTANRSKNEAEPSTSLKSLLAEDTALANTLAVHAVEKQIPWAQALGLAAVKMQEPGVGVYGYASFKGLEKLPYDLTLTGKPGSTPRAVKPDDPNAKKRVAKTPATFANHVEVQQREAALQQRPEDAVSITWGSNVPVTCAEDKSKPQGPSSALNRPLAEPAVRSGAHQDYAEGLYSPALFLPPQRPRAQNPSPANRGAQNPPAGGGSTDDQTKKTQESTQFTKTYTNEGLYKWDVSIGVSAFTAQKNTFSASDGTVRKSTSRPENVYVFGDYFPWKADLVDPPRFRWKPSFSGGIPAGSQPLNRSVAGVTFGFKIGAFHFSPFVGSLFLREYRPTTLGIGAKGTDAQLKADQKPQWNFRPFVSVNFSVKDAASLIKNKGTSQTKSASQSKSSTSSSKKSGS